MLFRNYFAIPHQSVQNKCFFAINTAAPMNGTSAKRKKTVRVVPKRFFLRLRTVDPLSGENVAVLSCLPANSGTSYRDSIVLLSFFYRSRVNRLW